jgi:hypothetical protein
MGVFPGAPRLSQPQEASPPGVPLFRFISLRLMMKNEIIRDPRRLPSEEECIKTTDQLNKDSKDAPLDSAALKQAMDDLGKVPQQRP